MPCIKRLSSKPSSRLLNKSLERTKALHENLKNTIAQSDANRVALKDENEELKVKECGG